MLAPVVGKAFYRGVEVIIPSYVRYSQRPKANGACDTVEDRASADGWYVEFRYPGAKLNDQHRTFIPF